MATLYPKDRQAALKILQRAFQTCMQCGMCSASCPHCQSMDYTPRQVWRFIQLGQFDDIWRSHTFWLCSNCYTCTLRCPRGLPLTEAVNTLKRLAPRDSLDDRRQAAFYEVFMDNIRKYGRIQEMDMMFHYFWVMKDPRVPLEFTPLGTKLLWQGKVHPGHPKIKGQGILERLFMKARQVEGTLCDTPTIQDAP